MKQPILVPFDKEPGVYAIEFESDDNEPMANRIVSRWTILSLQFSQTKGEET